MELPIIVEKIVYRNEKGFTILACSLNPYSEKYKPELEDVLLKHIKPNSYNNFTVTIDMMNAHEKAEGVQYICLGDFTRHPKFGDQFKAEYMYQDEPSNEDGLRSYLMTLPNIKSVRSDDIIKAFGFRETIRILDEDPMRLTEINGITENRVKPIKESWDRKKGERELCTWLHSHGVFPKEAQKIYATWKQDSLKILTENPYRLVELKNFGFMRADLIAHKIMLKLPKEHRVVAGLRHALDEGIYKNSNLCLPFGILRDNTIALLKKASEQNNPSGKFDESEYRKIIPQCIKKNLDIFAAIQNIHEPTGQYVYLKSIWEKEKYIASEIYQRRQIDKNGEERNTAESNRDVEEEQFSCNDKDLEDAEKDVTALSHRPIILDETQKQAIKSAFDNKITVITGGGGTGKSTICRCIFHLAHEKDLSVRMMSPTGKAAQVLSNKTGFTAETIHRSLKMMPGDEHPKETIREDVIIVDEVSMVGIDTMFAIMYAMKENIWGHLILVGDCNQLPSVSPGNFLSDIMKSNCVNIVKLDKIHRQDENSFIPILANDVARGQVVEIPKNATDIKWNNLSAYDDWEVSLRRVIKDFIGENNIDDLQIIAPMYKGIHGVNRANEVVQNFMADTNRVKDEPFHRGFTTFYVGDRVLQTENNYDKSIFNGDIGKVVGFGRKPMKENSDEPNDYVIVNFYGENTTYIDDEIEQLRLAWCITVHKFQGSQSPYIICIISSEANNMMTKELLYTAMTRAEKRLDIYGHMSAFRLAPTRSAVRTRYTHLNDLIRELKDNQKIFKILA